MSDSQEPDPIAKSSTDIESPPADIWDTICNDADTWLGPGSSIQPVEAGTVDANDIVTGTRRAGTVTSVRPGERLVFDWWPVGDPTESTSVSITLVPAGTQTRVLITETLPSRLTASASALSLTMLPTGLFRSPTTRWSAAPPVLAGTHPARRLRTMPPATMSSPWQPAQRATWGANAETALTGWPARHPRPATETTQPAQDTQADTDFAIAAPIWRIAMLSLALSNKVKVSA